MRSKSILARRQREEEAATPAEQRKRAAQGPLTLVSSAQGAPDGAKKHGLY